MPSDLLATALSCELFRDLEFMQHQAARLFASSAFCEACPVFLRWFAARTARVDESIESLPVWLRYRSVDLKVMILFRC